MPFPAWYLEESAAGRFILDSAHDWPSSPIEDDDPSWYERERRRFSYDDGKGEIYRELPSDWQFLPYIPGHFLHYSIKSPGMLAYTASYAHGEHDRQTIIKPGRYLNKFYPGLGGPEIARLASMVSALAKPAEIRWARTRQEIARVYQTGPSSCMSRSTRDYETDGVHPCEVYATPDIGVAYLHGDGGRIVARTIVRFRDNEPTAWIRLYGDELRLEAALSELGIEHDSNALDGARLLLIKTDDGNYVCPYLDGNRCNVTVDGSYLRIGSNGDYYASSVNGVVQVENGPACDCCGDHFDEGALTYIDDQDLCGSCLRSDYTWSAYEDRYIRDEDAITAYVENRRGRCEVTISRATLEDGDWIECDNTGNIVYYDLVVDLLRRGETNVRNVVQVDRDSIDPDEYATCGDDPDTYYHRDDMVEIDGCLYWQHSQSANGYSPTIDDPRQLALESAA